MRKRRAAVPSLVQQLFLRCFIKLCYEAVSTLLVALISARAFMYFPGNGENPSCALPPYPNPGAVVMAATNAYADANRKVTAAAAGFFSGNLHKPAAVDFRTVSQLARIVLISDDFITVEVGVVAFVVTEHFLHLLEGCLVLRIEAQHFCWRQRYNELLAQGAVGRKALIYLYSIIPDFYIEQVFVRSCLQALIHFVDGNCFPSLQLVVGDVYLAFGCEGCDA